jgi:signal peptidase I
MHDDNRENFFLEILKFGLTAVIIVLPIRLFIAQPFIVSGSSMEPTFHDKQYLIVDEISYRFDNPERGDVIVFRYPADESRYLIKRIIGLPGETVAIEGNQITVTTREGERVELDEPYVVNEGNGNSLTLVLNDDQYFVLGDNRPASSDSRIWGPLEEHEIVGRAFLRLLPLSDIDLFPGGVK